MAKLPFLIYRWAGRRFYYVEFRNPETGTSFPAVSTKKEAKAEAVEVAFGWLRDGIPGRNGATVTAREYGLRDMARRADVSPEDCEYICGELKRRGLLKSFVAAESRAAVPLADFLLDFWDWDRSAYVRERLRKAHGIHRPYVSEMRAAVAKYWVPLFPGKLLGEVTRRDVEALASRLEDWDAQVEGGGRGHHIRCGIRRT